jgi:hypothetical protein
MSTRACIKIKERINHADHEIILYHHCDGYPSGVGSDLKKYLTETVSKWGCGWHPELIATELVRGCIKDSEGDTDMGYKVAICEHPDCEYGYVIDCDKQTLTCYDLDYGIKPWKRVVEIPE